MIKAMLLHLSMNMWEDWAPESYMNRSAEPYRETYRHFDRMPFYYRERLWSDTIKTDDGVWKRVTADFAGRGGNMVIVDLGDAVKFSSHPEIAVNGAWSIAKLRDELARCRDLGLEVIPKFNFSACHDAWLHEYSRMLSTSTYYRVCRDLIAEAAELFDAPRFIHVGMDEELYAYQAGEGYRYRVERSGALWWDDLAFFCDEVRRAGARPWMWADKLWDCGDAEFAANVPRDVVQSNWYYQEPFDFDENTPECFECEKRQVTAYLRLDKLGYDQIPAGSNWSADGNYANMVEFCSRRLSPQHLLGFTMAPWYPVDRASEQILLEAAKLTETKKEMHPAEAAGQK